MPIETGRCRSGDRAQCAMGLAVVCSFECCVDEVLVNGKYIGDLEIRHAASASSLATYLRGKAFSGLSRGVV